MIMEEMFLKFVGILAHVLSYHTSSNNSPYVAMGNFTLLQVQQNPQRI